ncbi:MAG: helix-turn-helix domain-containing protein [Rhodospirillales bacterium]|nr:helix-turn-helix domain-containing protein [Rhodospirillales bacterium]MCB9995868.1 helix-turn-helix domain-containing protein [Rhodospirillales bacterium]
MQEQAGQQQPPQQDWAHYTDMPVGEILRRTRAYYSLTLNDVESALRIRASQLSALEEGDMEKLPGRVYAIGFVRAYAEFLGLDGDKMVHLFKSQIIGNKSKPELSFPVPASESKLPNVYILSGSLAGLVLMIAVVMVIAMGGKPDTEIPEVPQEMKMAAAPPPEAYGPPSPDMLAALEPAAGTEGVVEVPKHRVVIEVIDNAWVEVRNAEGEVLLSRVLKEGDSYLVPNEPGMVMDTGNIGALSFTVDGEQIAKLGETGDVRRGVSLDPDTLQAPHDEEAAAQTSDIVE